MKTHKNFGGTNLSTQIGTTTTALLEMGIADTLTETDLKLFLDPFRIKKYNNDLYEELNNKFLILKSQRIDIPPLELTGCGFATNIEHKYAPPVPYELYGKANSLISLRGVPGIGFARCSDIIAYLLLEYLIDYTNREISKLQKVFTFDTRSTSVEFFDFKTMKIQKKVLTSLFHTNSNLEKSVRLFIPIRFLTISHELAQNKELREIFFCDDTFKQLCKIAPNKENDILISKINYSNAKNKKERSKVQSYILESYPEIEDIFHSKMASDTSYHEYLTSQVLRTIKVGNLNIN